MYSLLENMEGFDKFYSYLNELHQSYEKLAALLTDKIEAVGKFDINRLESIMKEEQAYVLLSKGFDSNIENYRQKLSLKGTTLSEQVEELPNEIQEKFRRLAQVLIASVNMVKELNDKCQSLIQTKLYTLDKAIKEHEQAKPGTYGKAAEVENPKPDAPRMLLKSI